MKIKKWFSDKSKLKAMEIIIRKGSSKESMEQSLKQLKPKKGVNVTKYCGIMKLKKDALQIQKDMRNEWN